MSKKQVAGYILDRRIGKGSYATVWKGRVESGDEAVAVKVISRQTITETAQLRQEVEVLRRISHPNIVRFRDLKKSAAHYYLVLEYCAGGDLSQFVKTQGHVAEETARGFLTQIAAGLCVLHRENVLHRDLKPQNILLSDNSDNPVLKIADFGFARALSPEDMAATVCGSPLYMAPEILRHQPYDARADLWSVGAILFELLAGRPPYTGANPMQLLAHIERDGPDGDPFEALAVSDEGRAFLRQLLERSPQRRLSSREFAAHTYVRLDARPKMDSEAVLLEGGALPAAGEWCVPDARAQARSTAGPAAAPAAAAIAGVRSPSSAASPTASPLWQSPEASPRGPAESEPAPPPASPSAPPSAPPSRRGSHDPSGDQARVDLGRLRAPQEEHEAGAESPTVVIWPQRQGAGMEDEYIVVAAQQPVSAWARGRGPTPRAAASDFCGNLSRIAHTLERLAGRLRDGSPLEALALLLRALSLLEKALDVSLVEPETSAWLGAAFRRMLELAEAAAQQVRASQLPCGMESLHPPRPNHAIFEFAVQQAKDAAVVLSKGHEVGGWEAPCQEKLTLALLLLDLLSSEAEGEDVSVIASYTAPIARLVAQIESLMRPGGRPGPLQPQLGVA